MASRPGAILPAILMCGLAFNGAGLLSTVAPDEKSAVTIDLAHGQPAQPSAAAQNLEQLEQRLATTWRAGDCSAWGAMLAPEWSVIHISGQVISRSEGLKMCQAPRPPIETLNVDDLSVRTYGDAAVVTGRTTMTTGGKNPATVTLRFTDVFIRRAGRWQVVASHATQIGS